MLAKRPGRFALGPLSRSQRTVSVVAQLCIMGLPVIALILVGVVSQIADIPVADFTRDPSATMHTSPFVGIVSNVGVLIWCASSAICLFSGLVLLSNTENQHVACFVIASGLFSGLLMLDDFFMLHETLGRFAISEKIVYVLYGLLLLLGAFYFGRIVLSHDYDLLLTAFIMLGLSVGVDLFQDQVELIVGHWRILFEDGFKFLGIVAWSAWFTIFCLAQLGKQRPTV